MFSARPGMMPGTRVWTGSWFVAGFCAQANGRIVFGLRFALAMVLSLCGFGPGGMLGRGIVSGLTSRLTGRHGDDPWPNLGSMDRAGSLSRPETFLRRTLDLRISTRAGWRKTWAGAFWRVSWNGTRAAAVSGAETHTRNWAVDRAESETRAGPGTGASARARARAGAIARTKSKAMPGAVVEVWAENGALAGAVILSRTPRPGRRRGSVGVR